MVRDVGEAGRTSALTLAVKRLEEEIEKNPKNAHAWYIKGACCYQLGETSEEVRACFDNAEKLDPSLQKFLMNFNFQWA